MNRGVRFAARKVSDEIWRRCGCQISQSESWSLLPIVIACLMAGSRTAKCAPLDHSVHIERAISEKVDPCLGLHWQVLSNPAHPEWPRRLVVVDRGPNRNGNIRNIPASAANEAVNKIVGLPVENRISDDSQFDVTAPIVIHAGETVLVHQDTEVLQSRLLAVALQSAAPGQQMLVRLRIDSDAGQRSRGPVVKVVANGKGEATWAKQERNRL